MISTLRVPVQQSGTMGVTTQWRGPIQLRVLWSIKLGMEQASRNEGKLLNDADLATDDDD